MTHELFRLAKATEREVDLIVVCGAIGALIMFLLVGFLVWRDKRRGLRIGRATKVRRGKVRKR